ncbi:hypothetical protein UlMin_027990 [Ulmus minor]
MDGVPYSSVVGSVMYSMVSTRPDLANATSVLSQFMSNPGKEHWNTMKWLIRYIKGTTKVGLVYEKANGDVWLDGFVDSDYGGDTDKRRSMTYYVFCLSGCCVSWKSQLQPIVTLSSMEVEYIAATEAVNEGLWLQGLLKELGFLKGKATVFCDNQSAIHLCKNHMYHERTKHVDIRYHFI